MADSIAHGYAVYSQHVNIQSKLSNGFEDQKRLSLLSSNIQADQETSLRSFLTKRMERMEPLEGSGNIVSIPAGKVYDKNAMAYFYLMTDESCDSQSDDQAEGKRKEEEPKRIFLVCFIAVIETGLELFQPELDSYCNLLSPYIHKYMESVDVSEYLRHLEAWYDINICYIQRCFSYLGDQLSTVLFATFLGEETQLKGLSEEASRDFKIFLQCCSLSEILQDRNFKEAELSVSPTSMKSSIRGTPFAIEFEDEAFQIASQRTNPFCQDCIKSMRQAGNENPFKLRQIIENYKLKVIQDMNTFKRLTKQAETDYYALYRSFAFLLTCDNGEVLLRNAKTQCEDESDSSCKDILRVIGRFVDGKQGFEGIYKQDKAKLKARHLIKLLNC